MKKSELEELAKLAQQSLMYIEASNPTDIFLPCPYLISTSTEASNYVAESIKSHSRHSPVHRNEINLRVMERMESVMTSARDTEEELDLHRLYGIDSYNFDYEFSYAVKFAELPLGYIVSSFNFSKQVSEDFDDPLTQFLWLISDSFDEPEVEIPFDWESINKWWHERQHE